MPDRLAENLPRIEHLVPTLRALLARGADEPRPVLEPSRAGPPTVLVRRADGEEVRLHSRNDPEREARRLVDAVEIAPLASYVVLGLGLGYHVLELLRRVPPGTPVIVLERSPALAREFLARAELPRDRSLLLVPAVTADELYPLLRPHTEDLLTGPVVFLDHPPSTAAFPHEYGALRTAVTRWVQSGSMMLRTNMALGRKLMENRFANLRAYLSSPGIAGLRDRCRGFPVVVASAGPSLRRHLDRLGEVKRNAILIAVSTALKAVLGAGARPDFTVVLDYHDISRRYFEGLPPGAPIPLVADVQAAPGAIAAHPGPHLFFEDDLLSRLLPAQAGRHGVLQRGATVAHIAAAFALHLGAAPVILIGQDLSYSHGITHVPGTAIHAEWMPRTNRFCTLETLEWRSLMSEREHLVRVADLAGRAVYTDQSMLHYLKEFENLCAAHPGRIVNATEGGARIHGAENVPLAEALRRYGKPREPDPLAGAAAVEASAGAVAPDLRAAAEEIHRYLAGLERMNAGFAPILAALAAGRNADPHVLALREIEAGLEPVRRLDALLDAMDRSGEFARTRADRTILAAQPTGRALQAAQAERDRAFVVARVESCRELLALVEKERP